MTPLLEQAYTQIAQLPEADQDAIAALILEQLKDEQRWQKSFAQYPDALARLAQQALAEHRAGLIQPLDPDTL